MNRLYTIAVLKPPTRPTREVGPADFAPPAASAPPGEARRSAASGSSPWWPASRAASCSSPRARRRRPRARPALAPAACGESGRTELPPLPLVRLRAIRPSTRDLLVPPLTFRLLPWSNGAWRMSSDHTLGRSRACSPRREPSGGSSGRAPASCSPGSQRSRRRRHAAGTGNAFPDTISNQPATAQPPGEDRAGDSRSRSSSRAVHRDGRRPHEPRRCLLVRAPDLGAA